MNKGLELFAYVIMTNHVHVIVRSKEGKLSGTIRDFKKHTSGQIPELISTNNKESRREWLEMIFNYHAKFNKRTGARQLWTHENHAVELGTNEMINSRLNYIHNNPVRARWVENPPLVRACSLHDKKQNKMPGLNNLAFCFYISTKQQVVPAIVSRKQKYICETT